MKANIFLSKVKNRVQKLYKSYIYRALKQNNFSDTGKINQLALLLKYREYLAQHSPLPSMREVGFRVYSQTDEDGILLLILSVIGTQSYKVVEICAGDGIECNAANLIINHGWTGLLVDGNRKKIERGRYFYSQCKDTLIYPPKLVHTWIDRENVNSVIKENGFEGEVDLLSIDMDGVDYWIWESINVINARVVVVEFQSLWGYERSVTVPYARDFERLKTDPDYFGASLAAFNRLATRKGYRLVAVNKYCFNAFFVREDQAYDIPTLPVEACFFHPKVAKEIRDLYTEKMKNFTWIEV